MEFSGGIAEIEVIARRIDFLEQLQETPHHKPELVEELAHSRSTVDRAINALETAGFVERGADGYVTTQVGRLAAERYRSFLADERTILSASDVLESIPPDCEIPMALLAEATIVPIQGRHRLFEEIARQFQRTTRYRALLPRLIDSRHVRLCHSEVVHGEVDAEIRAPRALVTRLREEFPHLMGELVDAEGFTIRRVDTPPFALLIASDSPRDRTETADRDAWRSRETPESTVVLITYEGETATGFISTAADDAVRWALEYYDSFSDGGRPADADLRPAETAAAVPPFAGRLPGALRSQGFVRVDERYFDRREPMSPATGWRVGLGLPEVDAGYAIAREHDGENGERSVRDDLVARLEAGTDVALIGPPGSGKSTVCKRVACRWREREDGVVLYREGGMGQSFESPTILEALLERTRGPTLVVVEDAIRTDANAIFDVMRSVSGREDVVFLLDARESEWLDPEGDHIDTRLEAFRQEAIETVTVPRLAERDCVRLLDRFEKLTGEQLDVSVWDLVDDIQNASRGDDLATSGTMFLLFHRLSRYVDPLVEYEGAEMPTTLDADVGRLRSDLDDIGETAFDVGVLVNLLNATGMGVYPEYVHAVATATEDRADAGERAAVRAALDRLEGHVLFASPDDSGPVYRAVHSTWSVRFLAHLLETDRQATTRRVGRCLSALFSLADDTDRRRSIADLVGGESEALDAIVTDPTDWADETVVRLFGLGRAYPKFAPLFGTTAASEIDLPDACSTDVPLRCTMLRGRMLLRAGSLDGAEREFDRLEAASQSLPSPKAERFRFESVSGQCEIMRRRGENEAAAAYARRGLDLARTAGDERAEIRSLRTQATVAKTRGDLERASAHLSECLELLETVDAPHEEAKTAEAFGVVSRELGAYDDATAYFERSRAIFHDVGDRRGESKALGSLGNMATKRQRYEEAREYLLRALEIARDVGDPIIEASHLGDLGGLALMRGEITEARRYFEQVIPIAAETDKALLRRALSNRGAIARHLGNFDDAQEYFDRALECAREIGIDKAEAETLRNRALLRIREHRPFDAEEDAQRALEIARTVGDPKLKAECLEFLGYARIKAGAFESAEDPLQRALEIAREMGHPKREAEILGFLADVARGTGDLEGAEAYARDACALHENVDAPASATTRSILGHVAIDREAFDTAKACFSKALDAYRTMGFRPGIAEVLVARAHVARRTGEFDLAERSVSEGVEIAREDGYPVVEARGLLERGAIARDRRHFEDASTALERALETFREHDARYYEAGALFELGRLESERGNLDRARTRLAESADHYLEMGTNQRAIRVLESLRDVCERQEDHDAVATWRERRAELAAEAEFDAPPRALRE